MIKKIFLLAFFLSGLNGLLNAQDTYVSSCTNQEAAFQVGEKLEYKAYYHWTAIWVGIGKLEIDLQEESLDYRAVLHARAQGKTLKRYDWFFKVRDVYESYLDQNTLRPVKFLRQVREGGYQKDLQYTYDEDGDSLTIDFHQAQGHMRQENERRKINLCTQDLLSAFYYLRSMNLESLEVEDIVPVELVIDGDLFPVHLKYLGLEMVDGEIGDVECLRFEPLLLEGDVFTDGDKMEVFVSNDENLLPIMIKSDLSIGTIKVYLVSAENLRYPLQMEK